MMQHTPLRQAYRTFRVLGVRHLCVVDAKHHIVAMFTRTDMAEVAEDGASTQRMAMRDWAEAHFMEELQIPGASPSPRNSQTNPSTYENKALRRP